jgi:hypothetical protein
MAIAAGDSIFHNFECRCESDGPIGGLDGTGTVSDDIRVCPEKQFTESLARLIKTLSRDKTEHGERLTQ